MPTYEYECTKCGERTEIIQSITAAPKKKPDEPCPGCGERAPIRRLISGGGAVLFKGAGFYETDYRSESYKKAEKAEKESSSKPADNTTTAKSDSTSTTSAKTESAAPAKKPKESKKPKSSAE